MSIFIDKLVSDVHAAHSAFGKAEVSIEDVGDIVRATIKGLGMYVTENGEVGDPRPQPSTVYSGLRSSQQTGVRWNGSSRRRRGGRR